MWNVKKGQKKVFRYIGKPSIGVAQQVMHILTMKGGKCVIAEFDQANTFAIARVKMPRTRGEVAVEDWDPSIYKFYYPGEASSGILLSNWGRGMWPKVLTQEGKRIGVIYLHVRHFAGSRDLKRVIGDYVAWRTTYLQKKEKTSILR